MLIPILQNRNQNNERLGATGGLIRTISHSSSIVCHSPPWNNSVVAIRLLAQAQRMIVGGNEWPDFDYCSR
jgi:hypothetical protein